MISVLVGSDYSICEELFDLDAWPTIQLDFLDFSFLKTHKPTPPIIMVPDEKKGLEKIQPGSEVRTMRQDPESSGGESRYVVAEISSPSSVKE